MSKELLTLGMGEAQPGSGNFNVLVLDLQTNEIECIDLTKEQILPNPGNPKWDIGKITSVDSLKALQPDGCGNIKHSVFGNVALSPEEINLKEFKEYLDDIVVNFSEFKSNAHAVTALVKPRKIIQIDAEYDLRKEKTFRTRIKSVFPGETTQTSLLCKDYRWVTYWEHMENYNKVDIEMAKSNYVSLMNKANVDVYYVLYRRFFPNDSNYWIHGLHVI